MKLSILQEKIKKGLNITERVSSKSLTLPILNNTLISAEKSFLKLSATDLEIGINWWSLAKIEKEGDVTIPSRLLLNFINLLPNKKIDFTKRGDDLIVGCDKYNTKIKGFASEEFPIIPKVGKEEFISVKSIDFCKGLSQLVDISVPSTTRPEISGVYFNFKKDLVTTAATDSFRLGEKIISLKGKSFLSKEYSLIIPQKTIKEVINIFGEKEGEIKIYFSPNQIMFESLMQETNHEDVQIISRLIEGEYPNYKEIIPKKFTTQLTINKEDFINQIKSAALFSGKVNEIKLKVNSVKKEVDVLSQSIDIGDYKSSIPVKAKGEDATVSFNHKFLLDGLLNIKSSEIILDLNGDSGPGVLRPVGDDTYLYVVMPIKAS
jgi:DNA polymerase III subunit beta